MLKSYLISLVTTNSEHLEDNLDTHLDLSVILAMICHPNKYTTITFYSVKFNVFTIIKI